MFSDASERVRRTISWRHAIAVAAAAEGRAVEEHWAGKLLPVIRVSAIFGGFDLRM